MNAQSQSAYADTSASGGLAYTEDTLDDLLTAGPSIKYPKGQRVYTGSADKLYRVSTGLVRVYRIGGDGSTLIVGLYREGEVFGTECVSIHKGAHEEYAVAAVDSVLMAWPVAKVEQMIAKRPLLGLEMARLVVAENQRLLCRIGDLRRCHTKERLVMALLRYAAQFGTVDGVVVLPPFTHQNLADEIATTREWISHYMHELRGEGAIDYSRKAITVRVEALAVGLGGAR